jgi:hypothetical protein
MRDMSYSLLTKMFPFKLNPANIENYIFDMAGKFSEAYSGGLWQVDTVNGFDFLVAPDNSNSVAVADNYYQGIMDGRTFGAALTLLIYNRLLWRFAEQFPDTDVNELSDRFYALRDALTSESSGIDAAAIFQFLD